MLLAVLCFPSFYLSFWLWKIDVISYRQVQQYRQNRITKLKLPVFHIVQLTPWQKVHFVNFILVFVRGVPLVNKLQCLVNLLQKSFLWKSNHRCIQMHTDNLSACICACWYLARVATVTRRSLQTLVTRFNLVTLILEPLALVGCKIWTYKHLFIILLK